MVWAVSYIANKNIYYQYLYVFLNRNIVDLQCHANQLYSRMTPLYTYVCSFLMFFCIMVYPKKVNFLIFSSLTVWGYIQGDTQNN